MNKYLGEGLLAIFGAPVHLENPCQAAKLEYTAIGDLVDVASQIEQLNKKLDTEILVSDEGFRQLTFGPGPRRPRRYRTGQRHRGQRHRFPALPTSKRQSPGCLQLTARAYAGSGVSSVIVPVSPLFYSRQRWCNRAPR